MASFRAGSVAHQSSAIKSKRFGDDGILLNVNSGEYFQVDEIGMGIWARLDGQSTVGEIVEEMAPHFDVDENILLEDVVEFLEVLLSKELISVEQRT